MARYRVLKKSYLPANGSTIPRIFKPGEIIEFDGPCGDGLEPLDGGAAPHVKRRLPNGLQTPGGG